MTSKSEKKSTSREKLGFGMKYTLAVVISILAISALCFIYVSVATHFSPPLQPMFNQERLGQLGDFLGGTLNPIFGFATVYLLLWSVFIQRKELSLTRDELKKSAAALTDQVKLATDEYNRKQLQDILKTKTKEYEENIKQKFLPLTVVSDDTSENPQQEAIFTISQLIASQKRRTRIADRTPLPVIVNIVKDILNKEQMTQEESSRKYLFQVFKKNTEDISNIYLELLKITKIHSIQDNIEIEASSIINNARLIHAIETDYALTTIRKIEQLKATLRGHET